MENEQNAGTAVVSTGLLARCECGRTPRAYRVRVPHLTWTVICQCGDRTGYYSGGREAREAAVDAWNRSANAALTGGEAVPSDARLGSESKGGGQ